MKKEHSTRHLEIIDYLYGEMSQEEMTNFEGKMAADEELREEVNGIRNTRNALTQYPDNEQKEHQVPPLSGFYPRMQFAWLRPWLGVAASIVFLLIAGYLTDFSLRYDQEGLSIRFGGNPSGQFLTSLEAERMINEALADQQLTYNRELAKTKDSIDKFSNRLADFQKTGEPEMSGTPRNVVSEAEFRNQLAAWQSANNSLLQDYFSTLSTQQQEYFQEAMIQFSDYLQQQREQDLIMIQKNLIELKDYNDRQKMETNQSLAGIMKMVSQK